MKKLTASCSASFILKFIASSPCCWKTWMSRWRLPDYLWENLEEAPEIRGNQRLRFLPFYIGEIYRYQLYFHQASDSDRHRFLAWPMCQHRLAAWGNRGQGHPTTYRHDCGEYAPAATDHLPHEPGATSQKRRDSPTVGVAEENRRKSSQFSS